MKVEDQTVSREALYADEDATEEAGEAKPKKAAAKKAKKSEAKTDDAAKADDASA